MTAPHGPDGAARTPEHALVANVDLVVVRFDEDVSVMYGRCLHRGALMSDGFVRGDDLICGVHFSFVQVELRASSLIGESSVCQCASQ